jgi:hypothetical protein
MTTWPRWRKALYSVGVSALMAGLGALAALSFIRRHLGDRALAEPAAVVAVVATALVFGIGAWLLQKILWRLLDKQRLFDGRFPGATYVAVSTVGVDHPVMAGLQAMFVDDEGITFRRLFDGRVGLTAPWDEVGEMTVRRPAGGADLLTHYAIQVTIGGQRLTFEVYNSDAPRSVLMDERDLTQIIASLESHRPRATA